MDAYLKNIEHNLEKALKTNEQKLKDIHTKVLNKQIIENAILKTKLVEKNQQLSDANSQILKLISDIKEIKSYRRDNEPTLSSNNSLAITLTPAQENIPKIKKS